MNRTITIKTSDRERIRRALKNSILAAWHIVQHRSYAQSDAEKAKDAADMIVDDLLVSYRLVRRKP